MNPDLIFFSLFPGPIQALIEQHLISSVRDLEEVLKTSEYGDKVFCFLTRFCQQWINRSEVLPCDLNWMIVIPTKL